MKSGCSMLSLTAASADELLAEAVGKYSHRHFYHCSSKNDKSYKDGQKKVMEGDWTIFVHMGVSVETRAALWLC